MRDFSQGSRSCQKPSIFQLARQACLIRQDACPAPQTGCIINNLARSHPFDNLFLK